jgi:chromosome segregation ATPase
MSSIDALKTKRFDLEDQLDEFEDMDLSALSGREKKKYYRLKRRLEDVNEQIDELEEDMEGLKSAPKRLNYCNT